MSDHLFEDSAWRAASSCERLVLLAVTVRLGVAGISRLYTEEVADITGLDRETCEKAISRLVELNLLEKESSIVAIGQRVALLALDTTISAGMRGMIASQLDALPQLAIVSRVRERYFETMSPSVDVPQTTLFEEDSDASEEPSSRYRVRYRDRTKDENTLSRSLPRAATVSRADIERVIAKHIELHPRRRPGEKERKIVERALRAGHTVDELAEAMIGNARDTWHLARQKHEIGYVLRDADHIGQFRDRYAAQQAALNAPKNVAVSPAATNGYRRESPGEQLLRETAERRAMTPAPPAASANGNGKRGPDHAPIAPESRLSHDPREIAVVPPPRQTRS